MGWPELTGVALAVLVMTSCGAPTIIVADAVRVSGLLLVEVTVAVFTSAPLKVAAVVPVTTKVTLAPGARLPRVSVKVLLLRRAGEMPVTLLVVVTLLHAPPVGAGSGSVKLTPRAVPA